MDGFLTAKGGGPFAHVEPGLINTNLVGKCRLKGFLPVVLKFLQAIFRAAARIAHPAEALVKKLPYICDPVIIKAVHHTLNHSAGFICL